MPGLSEAGRRIVTSTSGELFDCSDDQTAERLRLLLETAPDAIVVVDARGSVVFVNRQTERLFGFSADELIGSGLEQLLPERFRGSHGQHLARYCADPELRPMGAGLQLLGQRKDGHEFPVEISLSPIRLDGELLISSVIRDVTRRRELERRLRSALDEAEVATATKSRFIAAASHDLRQPLQAASLYLELATRGQLKRPQLDETVGKVKRCVDSLSSVLDKVLHISKLDAGSVAASKRSVDLRELFLRLKEQFAPQAEARGLELRVIEPHSAVHTDSVLLFQVLENLVSNALRYTERGRVLLGCRRSGSNVRIQVWDTGVGIAPEDVDRVFEEFRRVGSASSITDEGLGLGLAIVRRLAAILGHRVGVRSTLGSGSLFEVVVPRAHGGLESYEVEPVVADDQQVIAVLDNDPSVLDALVAVLEMDGYRVVADKTIEGLLGGLRSEGRVPSALLSDYRLGETVTGLDAIEVLRREYGEQMGAVLLTGDSSFQALTEKSERGRFSVLAKPVDTARLTRELRRGSPVHVTDGHDL
jgi:PAS domain S-box-containing protein